MLQAIYLARTRRRYINRIRIMFHVILYADAGFDADWVSQAVSEPGSSSSAIDIWEPPNTLTLSRIFEHAHIIVNVFVNNSKYIYYYSVHRWSCQLVLLLLLPFLFHVIFPLPICFFDRGATNTNRVSRHRRLRPDDYYDKQYQILLSSCCCRRRRWRSTTQPYGLTFSLVKPCWLAAVPFPKDRTISAMSPTVKLTTTAEPFTGNNDVPLAHQNLRLSAQFILSNQPQAKLTRPTPHRQQPMTKKYWPVITCIYYSVE